MAGALSYDAARNTGIESAATANTSSNNTVPLRRAVPRAQKSQPNMRSSSLEPTRLRKPMHDTQHARAVSNQFLEPPMQHHRQSLTGLDKQQVPITPIRPGLPPPPPLSTGTTHSRNSSYERPLPLTPSPNAAGSRPVTPQYALPRSSIASSPTSKLSKAPEKKKHGWFGKSKEKDADRPPFAWIAGHPDKPAFDIENMAKGVGVPELWDDHTGSCYVYLFSKQSGKGPSFKVNPAIFASSPVLTKLVSRWDSSGAPPRTNGQLTSAAQKIESHMYLTLKLSDAANAHGISATPREPKPEDLQVLVDFRNLFAFLCGQSLVATEKRTTIFSIFVNIGTLLKAYEFSNADGSTFGDVANASFDNYAVELTLLDVRSSREKTIEGIVLGEKMRSPVLYTEAFTHAVGKLDDIVALHSPKFDLISSTTKHKLSRSALSLQKTTEAVQLELKDFDFHSIFYGIMNSKTAEERKEGVRFEAWKEAVLNTRKWLLASLKQRYGDWPPKAKSKKNDLGVDGMQRQVIQELYQDMCSMYDLLVDKTQLTTRTADGIDRAGPVEAPKVRALRSILSEFDRSSPPVKPPIPFDLPIWPTLRSARKDFGTGDIARDAKQATKKLRDDEIAIVLRASYNHDAAFTPFVMAFTDMERRAAHGCSLQEIIDQRVGQWIFMYAVLQTLPLLACDAPGLKYTQGVDYFLSEPPRGYMPWVDPEKATQQRTWFAVNGAASMVSLPSHVLEHGTDAVFRRSHCWLMAEKWTASNPLLNQALHEQSTTQDAIPNGGGMEHPRKPASRTASPAASLRNSSITLGLEALPLPPGIMPENGSTAGRPRSVHIVDANKTFDSIIANMGAPKSKKK